MLLEFYGKNFGCFRDEFRLSMLATDVDPGSDRGIVEVKVEGEDEPLRLLRAVAIYGPNGSGKSTVLRAAAGLGRLVGETGTFRSDSPIPQYEPFALDAKCKRECVLLGIKAILDGHVYDYQVHFKRTAFTGERLVCWEKPDEERVLFDRDGQEVKGEWKDNQRFTLLSQDFRPNALLLSIADRLTPSLARNIAVGIRRSLMRFAVSLVDNWLSEGKFYPASPVAKRAHEDSAFRGWLLAQLKFADVGVVDLDAERKESLDHGEDTHIGIQRDETSYRLSLIHRGTKGSFSMPYSSESEGTKRFVEFAPMLFDLAHESTPQAIFVDEIDQSLHPVLLQGIMRHLNCDIPLKAVRGQLIFATHDTTLIDAEAKNAVLRRDQIYLTEKDASGAARLYSVAEFKERNNLNLRRRYLQGRYGALPSLGAFAE